MKKRQSRIALFLAFCMLLSLAVFQAPAPTAQAAGVTVTAEDVTVPAGGGNATVKATVKNNSDTEITSVKFTFSNNADYSKLFENITIAVGSSRTFSLTGVPFAAADVGNSVTLTADTNAGTATTTFRVNKKAETVSVSFTRTLSKTTVAPGSSVKLTYNIKNTGTADITDVKLTDAAVGSDAIASGVTITAGSSKQYSKTITVDKSVTSTPKLSYTANGKTYTKNLDSERITVSNPSLSISAIADKSTVEAGDKVTFTIALRNAGKVAVNDIKVVDEQGNVVRSSIDVPAGSDDNPQMKSITYETVVNQPRNAVFTATFKSGDDTKSVSSDAIYVHVSGFSTPAPGTSSYLSITASASPTEMTFPGNVVFTIEVKNSGATDLTNVVVSESRLGTIATIDTLKAGESKTVTKEAVVTSASSYVFEVSGTGEDGSTQTNVAPTVALTDSATPTPDVINPADSGQLGSLFVWMIIIVVLIILAGVALTVLMIQEKRAKNGKGPKGKGPNGKGPGGKGPDGKGPSSGVRNSRDRALPHEPDSASRNKERRTSDENVRPVRRRPPVDADDASVTSLPKSNTPYNEDLRASNSQEHMGTQAAAAGLFAGAVAADASSRRKVYTLDEEGHRTPLNPSENAQETQMFAPVRPTDSNRKSSDASNEPRARRRTVADLDDEPSASSRRSSRRTAPDSPEENRPSRRRATVADLEEDTPVSRRSSTRRPVTDWEEDVPRTRRRITVADLDDTAPVPARRISRRTMHEEEAVRRPVARRETARDWEEDDVPRRRSRSLEEDDLDIPRRTRKR